MNSQPLGGHVQDLQKFDPDKSQHEGGEVGINATEELMTFDSSSKTEHLSIIGHLVGRPHSRASPIPGVIGQHKNWTPWI